MSGPLGSSQWMYASGDFEIEQSLKFEQSRSAYLSRTFVTPTNRKIWTFSFWFKRGNLSGSSERRIFSTATGAGGNTDNINYTTGDAIRFIADFGQLICTQVFRDPSAWYHLMYVYDSTQSTASNRLKLYVNGTQVTSFSTTNYPSLNQEIDFNSAVVHDIGRNLPETTQYYDGYLAELYWVDGQAKAPADFGETGDYGEWKPIKYSGSYGTNGFYLPFKQDYTVEGFSATTWKNDAPQYVGGVGFKPDLIWTKSIASQGHAISDSITGFDRYGQTNSTADFYTPAEIDQSLNPTTDGFKSNAGWHSAGHEYVAWAWDMGDDSPTGFGCRVYTGNASEAMIGGFGFQPDLLWIKNRDDAASSNVGNVEIFDAIRGPKEILRGNTTGAEIEEAAAWGVDRFTTDGFNLSNQGYYGNVNVNDKTFVAWGWDMGGTTATNTSGSIDSTVMANTAKGQSIVSWTGTGANATVGHGLSSAPELIILKNRDESQNWGVFHKDLNDGTDSGEYNLFLNENSGEASGEGFWNDTVPASTVFSVGSATQANGSSDKMIAYCFHSVSGYSSIGSYTGNANTTGPSVTTGFRPAFILFKKEAAGANWFVIDNARGPFNTIQTSITIDNAQNESYAGTTAKIDFNDNGFQIRNSNNDVNANNVKYRYIAFAGGLDSISDYNTDGSIDARVKANTTYGQSIVSYIGTGATGTVGHGLGAAPELVIIKRKDAADNWVVQRQTGNILTLQTDNAEGASNNFIQTLGSSTFTLGDGSNTPDSAVCADGGEYLAYCWRSITGYSKIGTYTGNGDGDGPTVTLGFRPAFILIKPSSAQDHWNIYDTTRDPGPTVDKLLFPNRNVAQGTGQDILISDTGFQLKSDNSGSNGNNVTYIYMAFADKREYAYWLDQSGNNNDWTSNNLTESDISVDSPSNNFATLNPLDSRSASIAEGNLQNTPIGSNHWSTTRSTIAMPSGSWYAEFYAKAGTGNGNNFVGIATQSEYIKYISDGSSPPGTSSTSWAYSDNDNIYNNGSIINSTGITWVTGDIIGVTFTGTVLKFYKNNSLVATISSIPVNDYCFITSSWTTSMSTIANFGQDSSFAGNKTAQGNQDGNSIGDFYYTPPTGYLTLCTKNLPDVDVVPSEHFNVKLYVGNGSNKNASGIGFQPDFTWIKMRSASMDHMLMDAVRGATKNLYSNGTDVEGSIGLTSFNSDGFTTQSNVKVSTNGGNYVAWNWKANGSGSSNTNGSITSTVSANVDAGFSIVSYTGNQTAGATVGHGLSSTPELVITKLRSTTGHWLVNHSSFDGDEYLVLNLSEAKGDTGTEYWNGTMPNSTVFTLGAGETNNRNNATHIAYCFHSVDGYSKVGSYTGNGSTDGTFVYTSFAPAYILWKNITDNGTNWVVFDNKRDTFNPNDDDLYPNAATAEEEDFDMDFLSNGFKLRNTSSWANSGGKSYIYIAFAETPFKYSNGK